MQCSPFSCFVTNTSSIETADNTSIEKHLKLSEKAGAKTIRILLLGPDSSGKTTIVKQIKKLHSLDDFDELNNRRSIAQCVKISVIDYMKILCVESVELNKKYNENTLVSADNEHLLHEILSLEPPYKLTYDIAQKIKKLWRDNGIKNTLAKREYFQIDENVEYFFDRIDCINTNSYTPSFADYIRFSQITSGFTQTNIDINVDNFGVCKFDFTDTCGQPSERRKWMQHISDDINAVIYVLALSDYDLTMFEDNKTNRLIYSIELFRDTIIKGNFFRNKSVLIFFNKYDLFVEKIKKTSIRVAFDDFPVQELNPNDADDVVRFVAEKFLSVFIDTNASLNGPLHIMRTRALDTNDMEKVFNIVNIDLVQENVRKLNIM